MYDDRAVAPLVFFAMMWAIVAMGCGLWAAAEMAFPSLNFNLPWLSFGRLRTVHTNAAIFGFGGSALMAASLYSAQRTCRARLFMPSLALFVVIAWQLILLFGAASLFAGINQGKEYAELPWVLDVAVTGVWLCYAAVFFGTLARRTVAPIYVSNWFFAAFIIVVAMLHVVNSLAIPLGWGDSMPVYAGAQDAIVQWWYGHNAVGFFSDRRLFGNDVLFSPQNHRPPDLVVSHFHSGVLVVHLHLHLGGAASLALQRDSRLDTDAGDGDEFDFARAVVGDDD